MKLQQAPILKVAMATLLCAWPVAAHCAHTGPPGASVCGLLSESRVRALTNVPDDRFSETSINPSASWQRCVYTVSDSTLVLDVLHLGSDAAAIAKMDDLGSVKNSNNNTSSPYGTDQVASASRFYQAGKVHDDSILSVTGYAARHGSTIVAIGMTADSGRTHAQQKQLEADLLTMAGAHIVPWPTAEECSRIPPARVQTLVSLGPARLSTHKSTSTGGVSKCNYEFAVAGKGSGSGTVYVNIESDVYINDQEALQGFAKEGASPKTPPFATGDPADRVSLTGTRREAVALHAGNVSTVDVVVPDDSARAQPSFSAQLEAAAVLAAGGSVVGGSEALAGIPEPRKLSTSDNIRLWFQPYESAALGMLIILGPVLGFPLWSIFSHLRRRRLIRTGLHGVARVDSIGDTGVTINNSPVIRLHMTVTPDGGMPYTVSMRQRVSRLEAPASWIGRQVEVRIDPSNPQRLVISP